MTRTIRSEKRRRTEFVAIRMTPEEKRIVVACAESAGVSVGRFMREATLGWAKP